MALNNGASVFDMSPRHYRMPSQAREDGGEIDLPCFSICQLMCAMLFCHYRRKKKTHTQLAEDKSHPDQRHL